jgi:hypothetical protein
MLKAVTRTVAAAGIAALTLGAVSTVSVFAGLDGAYAKGGGGNGGGNAGGNGGGNGGGSAGKSASAGTKATGSGGSKKAKVVATEEVVVGAPNANGKLRSELKGLNAVHANPQALANAAPNSQVGRIAAYKTAALGTIAAAEAALTAQADKDAAQALLDSANADLAVLDEAYTGLSTAEIDATVAALDPAALDYQAQLDALNADRTAAAQHEADRAELQTAADNAAAAVTEADLDLTEAEAEAEAAETAESDALLMASGGRELSNEAIAYIRDLLGL